jgi:RimJ/RimL family protein N-acetyltransferase
MFIRSERLFLRPGWPEDWSDLHTLLDDEALARQLSRVPWPCRADDIRALSGMAQPPRHPQFLITLPDHHGAHVVGMVGFAEADGETELGVWIGRKWWNRGFATEAVRAALSVARTLGHCRLVASHFADSPGAGRVLAKLGFVPTGQQRLRHSAARGRAEAAQVHVLNLCPPASDPADPEVLRRAA